MALIRFQIDLAIPETVYDAIPSATKTAIRDRIRQLKALAIKINEGAANEEATTRAVRHKCYHDETPPKPCEPAQEI